MLIFIITITGFVMALTNLYSHYPSGPRTGKNGKEKEDKQKDGLMT